LTGQILPGRGARPAAGYLNPWPAPAARGSPVTGVPAGPG